MDHPSSVLYLEHDGKVLLVDSEGNGPQKPVMNNTGKTKFRFPTESEVTAMGIKWNVKNTFNILGFQVSKGHPEVEWPEHWAWKDECISDDCSPPNCTRGNLQVNTPFSIEGNGAKSTR